MSASGRDWRETSHDLMTIDTCDVMEHEVVVSMDQIAEVGKGLYDHYVQTRVDKASSPSQTPSPAMASTHL